jgi:hypothetical protein
VPRRPAERGAVDDYTQEVRREAIAFLLFAATLLVALALASIRDGWELRGVGGWIWFVLGAPELLLACVLLYSTRMDDYDRGHRLLKVFLAIVVLANAFGLGLLVSSLLTETPSGGQLLASAIVLWFTNVIVFGLCFWTLDGGGPLKRGAEGRGHRDFQFPQDEDDALAAGWHPRLEDYTYVAFTNGIAFSPTDAMPLTRWAKSLMALGSTLSVVTILVIAARAVNVLS